MQNWDAEQDEWGIMYFANTDGVLIFDGIRWELITLPGTAYCFSVASDKHGRVYIGGSGELGYIMKDASGNYTYHSLLPSLPKEIQNMLGEIWDTEVLGSTLFFSDMQHCYVYDLAKGKIKILDEQSLWPIHLADSIYALKNGGMYVYKQDAFRPMNLLTDTKILLVSEYGENGYMLLDDKKQLWTLEGNASIKKPKLFSEAVNTALKDIPVKRFRPLPGGRIAVVSNHQILIFSIHGELLSRIGGNVLDESTLSDELFLEDINRNLWFATNEFIGMVITSSPLSYYDKHNNLRGSVFTLGQYHGQQYAGTNLGLYRLKDKDTFEFLPNTGTVWEMYSFNDRLYLACDSGVSEIDNKNYPRVIIRDNGVLSLCSVSHRKDRLIMGTYGNGIWLLSEKDGAWSKRRIKGFNEETRYIQEDDHGNFWIAHYGKGIWKLRLNDALDAVIEKKFYTSAQGLPSDMHNRIYKLNDKTIIATTGNGIYTYNSSTNRFNPDPRFSKALQGYLISAIAESQEGYIYFRGRSINKNEEMAGMLIKGKDGIYDALITPFNKISWAETDPRLITTNDGVWIGSNNKLIVYNHKQETYFHKPLRSIIKKITTIDSVIYTNKNINDSIYITTTIPFSQNSLRFDFDIVHFEDAEKNEFQYKLVGFDKTWSDWTTAREAHFTNLPEGNYTFMVRARNSYKVESKPSSFSFYITPPVYRTLWAYGIYLVLLGLIVYGIILQRTKQVNRQKELLEREVTEKTKELLAMNEEIMAQNEEISNINEEVNRQNIEIESQSKILRQSNYTKDKLFSIISHDLRGPIFQFREVFSMIESGYISESEFQNKLIPEMKERINYVATLTDNLLHWAKDQMEGIQVKPSSFNLQDIVDENINLLCAQALRKSIQLNSHLQNTLYAYADKDMIKLVLRNLLSNAVKFTPENGSIEVKIRTENNYVYISVKDSGVGLSQEEIDKILGKEYFTKYGTAGEKGSGLGLMLCREFVEKNGGTLLIESKRGEGSIFTFNVKNADASLK
ncbi:MAG TPA: ATP-binding protein [Ohtaekwangia sp.]|uniref:sensor histidine kinase n=1 Tax=Ohtaekwangia sp. TaxID=2066019 RepID=UPI002F95F817